MAISSPDINWNPRSTLTSCGAYTSSIPAIVTLTTSTPSNSSASPAAPSVPAPTDSARVDPITELTKQFAQLSLLLQAALRGFPASRSSQSQISKPSRCIWCYSVEHHLCNASACLGLSGSCVLYKGVVISRS